MTAREAIWEGERERLQADLHGREQLAAQRMQAVEQLHQRWGRRRRREVEWLRNEQAVCEKLRRDWSVLRETWLGRIAALEQEQRAVAERALALEQFQHELMGQAIDVGVAEKRIERLRRRWASLSAAAQKGLAQQREELAEEAAQLEEDRKRIQKQASRLAAQTEELSAQQAAWESEQLKLNDQLGQMRWGLSTAIVHRDRHEKQANDLRDEVERLARLLLDEGEPILQMPASKAA